MDRNRFFLGFALAVVIFVVSYGVWMPDNSVTTTTLKITSTTIPTITTTNGPASDSVVFKQVPSENATKALLSGEIDYYLTSLTAEQALELRNNPEIKLYYAASQINGIILNPAPAASGSLNPFSLQEVRFAMQYLLDRDKMVDEIQNGFGMPIVTNLLPTQPSYEIVKDIVDGYDITYNRQKADQMISNSLLDAGAEKIDGKWTYGGEEITLTVLMPASYPELKGIGDSISSELESVGFNVERVYIKKGEDYPSDFSDPINLKWNVDVTAWIYYGHSRYEGASFLELYSKDGWWTYNNTGIIAVNDKLQNYSSEAEWEQLNRELANLSILDSVGIWVTAKNNVFAARSDVQGLTDDRFVGLRSYGNIREAYVAGKTDLTVGADALYYQGDSWNPVVIEHINMMDVANTLNDPATWDNPLTLEKQPFRLGYSIKTNGPDTQLDVPQDAFVWNATSKTWVPVGEGTTAKTKLTYDMSKYVGGIWHHNAVITWADVLYSIASYWDMSYDDAKTRLSGSRWRTYFEPIRGLRIVDDKLEVYLDKWSFDDDELLVLDSVFQRSAPWALFAAMDKTIYDDGRLVYDRYSKPDGLNASAMCLVNSSHIQIVMENLEKLKYSEVAPFITVSSKAYATETDLNERIAAVKSWNIRYGNLVIGSGPFYMVKYDSIDNSIEMNAFRDPLYPFKKGDWLQSERARINSEFRDFIKAYESKVVDLNREIDIAYFDASISGRDEDYEKMSELQIKLTDVYSNREDFAKLKVFRESGAITDEKLKRQLDLLYNSYLENQIDEKKLAELIELQNKVEQKFNTFRVELNGKNISDNDVDVILTTSTDSQELEAAWAGSKSIGGIVSEDVIRLVKMRNQIATELGFKNYYEMQLILAEQDPAEIDNVMEELDTLTSKDYELLKGEIDDYLSARDNISQDELMPWHYQNRFFQDVPSIYEVNFDSYYLGKDPVNITANYYAGIGLPINDLLNKSDLYEREGKYQHAYTVDIDRQGDVRVVANVRPNSYWMKTLLHEYGHAVYFKNIDSTLPWELRSVPHLLNTEGIAIIMERQAYNPAWMHENVGISTAEEQKILKDSISYQRAYELIFSRWTLIMYEFEKSMYENPDQDLNKLWWNLVEKYQLITPPQGRNEPDWASKIHLVNSPVYYHNYILGEMFASQVHYKLMRDILNASSQSYTGQKEVGQYLTDEVFAPGDTYNWNELTERATGEKLTAKYFAMQYMSPQAAS